jgi:hypothetical protein
MNTFRIRTHEINMAFRLDLSTTTAAEDGRDTLAWDCKARLAGAET